MEQSKEDELFEAQRQAVSVAVSLVGWDYPRIFGDSICVDCGPQVIDV